MLIYTYFLYYCHNRYQTNSYQSVILSESDLSGNFLSYIILENMRLLLSHSVVLKIKYYVHKLKL